VAAHLVGLVRGEPARHLEGRLEAARLETDAIQLIGGVGAARLAVRVDEQGLRLLGLAADAMQLGQEEARRLVLGRELERALRVLERLVEQACCASSAASLRWR